MHCTTTHRLTDHVQRWIPVTVMDTVARMGMVMAALCIAIVLIRKFHFWNYFRK